MTAYARAVVGEEIVAGKLVRLACERHLRDLDLARAGRTPYRFDARAIKRSEVPFFKLLKQTKGEWAGQPLELQPWQIFIIGSVLGWKRKDDGTRRFRHAYTSVARKNGKSTLGAGLGIRMAFFDEEPGAEAYCAATKRDQAKIVWGESKRMVLRTRQLRKRLKVGAGNLHDLRTGSKLEPLGADADTLDGLNTSFYILDELHAHKTRSMMDVLDTSTGARRQPLGFVITTAGFDRNSVCWEEHLYSTRILEGLAEDDTWFAFIASIDDEDDWQDEEVWPKANPNLFVSAKIDDMRRKALKARQSPSSLNGFLRLHMNRWTEQSQRWMPMDKWDACERPRDARELLGLPCFGGLDLGETRDIAALALVFPDGVYYDALLFCWIPEEGMRLRSKRDRVPYDVWQREGLLRATPGRVTDYEFLRRDINALAERYDVKRIAFDRWNATQLITRLQEDAGDIGDRSPEDARLVRWGQGFVDMAAPTKELERLVVQGYLRHGANPILRWMASNVAVRLDPANNMKIDKARSFEKVDGMVALAMALGVSMRFSEPPPERGSVYDERGMRAL